MRILPALFVYAVSASAQSFDVATVKASGHPVGKDYRGALLVEPGRVSARNVSLLYLIGEAYHVQPFQVTGGPKWLDEDEFDIDARSDAHFTAEQMRTMLQALLAERFRLAAHRDKKEMRVYALAAGPGGAKLHPSTGDPKPTTSPANFHGSMRDLANLISIGLSIPVVDDPTRPAIASGAPVPVLDETGLEGRYDVSFQLAHDGGDSYTRWQNALHDFGLRLESRRGPVEVLAVDRVERTPSGQ